MNLSSARTELPAFLAKAIADPRAAEAARQAVEHLFLERTDEELLAMVEAVAGVGEEPHLYLANELCRQVQRTWARAVLPTWSLEGAEHLDRAREQGPTLLIANHLSYFDSGAIDVLLAWDGHDEAADHIVSAAGPKVYATPFRRYASACLNTLPVPQSTTFEHTAQLSPRDLARRARASVESAHRALSDGYSLLLFAEGSRSRSRRLQPFLKATHRYLAVPGAQLVPVAITGTETLFGVDDERLRPGSCTVRFGPALALDDLAGTRVALDVLHEAVRSLLPEDYRPEA